MYRDGSQNYSRNWKKENHIPYFGAISSLLLLFASIRPIFCNFKTVFLYSYLFSPFVNVNLPTCVSDHCILLNLWFSLALRNFKLQHIPKIKLVWKRSLYISRVFMQFVLYYAMTQRYFQMFFGVQEKPNFFATNS